MKRLLISLITLLVFNIHASLAQHYVIPFEGDSTSCEELNSDGTKCTNGKETIKFKQQAIKQYFYNDTLYVAVNGFKKKGIIHAFYVLGNDKHHIYQYDYLEYQSSGPAISKSKLLICSPTHEFIEELLLNETTPTTLNKYFKGCIVFDDELNRFKKDTSKRHFPMKDFKHLVNVYYNSCELKK